MRHSIILILIFMHLKTFQICISKSTTLSRSIFNETDNIGNSVPDLDHDYRSKYAQQMLSYMNHSVSPCEDFYEYACGNWKNVIEERYVGTKRQNLYDINYKLENFIEDMLQKRNINDLAPQYADEFELSKKFYYGCMDAELYPMQKSLEYLNVLNHMGGFPAVNSSWKSDEFSWFNMSAHLTNYGVVGLIKEYVSIQYPHPPYFRIPDLGFDINLYHDNIEDSNSSNAYKLNYKRMHDILSLYGVDQSRIIPIITDIFEFLKAVIHITKEATGDCLSRLREYNKDDVEETDPVFKLVQAYYEISWTQKDMPVKLITCDLFYRHMIKVGEKYKEAAANYLSLKFLYHMDARLTDKIFQKDYCLFEIRQSMPYLFDHLYMKIIFNKKTIDEATNIAKEVRRSIRAVIQEADWLDNESRNDALLRETTLTDYIGRYENKTLTERLIKDVKNLKFIDNNYEANNLILKQFIQYLKRFCCIYHKELGNLMGDINFLLGMQTDAWYNPINDGIFIFYGNLQTPVFNIEWPNSLKFGTLGYFYGHELTHAFQNGGWLSTKSDEIFNKRSACYVDYYHKYLVPEINRNINGKNTKNENICDVEGLRLALRVYRQYIKKLTNNNFDVNSTLYKDEQMPLLDLTPEQLFFLGFAQLSCSSYTEADYWKYITDEHAIDKYRVLGSLSNNEDFAKIYNCPLGSKMNPSVDKCKLW